MLGFLLIAPFWNLIQVFLLGGVHEIVAFQSTCATAFVASSLEVMTAGVSSTFTITAIDYPGNPCTLGSEMFGFTLRQYPESSPLSPRSSSQWSVSPPNQFSLPLAITSSGNYRAEVVRFGKRRRSSLFIICVRHFVHLMRMSRYRP